MLQPEFSTPNHEPFFVYQGIKVIGLAEHGPNPNISPQTVKQILDRFPAGFWQQTILKKIQFIDCPVYSALRLTRYGTFNLIYGIPSSEVGKLELLNSLVGGVVLLQDDDKIVTRKRGVTIEGEEIYLFSTENWDDQHNPQTDAENAQFALAHEIGHVTWKMLFQIEKPETDESFSREDLLDFARLPKSQLPRYQAYAPIVEQEFQNSENGSTSLPLLLFEEDFAICHEYYFYWQNLAEQDPARHAQLKNIYDLFVGTPSSSDRTSEF